MKNLFIDFKKQHPKGLTFIELLAVLSILAVLSTVALRSVVGSFEEKSYDANIRQLEEIELAVMGSENYAGFVADIGRLPVVNEDPTDIDNPYRMSELWEKPAGLEDYKIRTFPAGETDQTKIEARLGTGWRGPYLQLGLARDELYDGFSNPFVLEKAANAIALDGEEITTVRSLGADNATGGDSYNEDLSVSFEATIDNFEVNVTVTNSNASATPFDLILRLYGVEKTDGQLVVIEQQKEKVTASANGGVEIITFILDGDGKLTSNPGIGIGPKVIRAYVNNRSATEPIKTLPVLISTFSKDTTSSTPPPPILPPSSRPKRINISRLGPTEEVLSVDIP